VIGKAKKPLLFKGTEANCIPVHYYDQKGAWTDREILENLFHKHFVPEVQAFLKEKEDYHRKQCCCWTMPLLIQETKY
jgi:hypothetical protein